MERRIKLEVCVDTARGLLAAVAAGADRIELCAALALQGLTPAPGLMALAASLPCPSYAMIRPRHGDFVYDALDADLIRRDIDAARAAGLAGVVLGANRPSGELDAELLAALVEHAAGLGLTLHRAVDLAPDLSAALETGVALGFERILTSGGALSAPAGAEAIARMVAQADGRISIMAGAGLSPENVAELVRRTGVREVHGSCGAPMPAGSERAQGMGFAPAGLRDTSGEVVARMVAALDGLGA
jgi:copper homeostasis protein